VQQQRLERLLRTTPSYLLVRQTVFVTDLRFSVIVAIWTRRRPDAANPAFSEGGYEPTATAVGPESEKLLKVAICELLAVEPPADDDQ